jgi:hypothetical protein
MRLVLAKLPVPVLWNLTEPRMDDTMVDKLLAVVKKSMEMWIQNDIDRSIRTRDLL